MKMVQKFVVALIAVVGFVACQTSLAQVVPFKSRGVNNNYNPSTLAFGGNGITSHMGNTTGGGIACSVPLTGFQQPTWVFAWQVTGTAEFVARNGDKVFFTTAPIPSDPSLSVNKVYVDTTNFPICTAVWRGKFIVTGGTGRFANVGPGTAPLDVIAINHPFNIVTNTTSWLYDYTITGDIDLGRK